MADRYPAPRISESANHRGDCLKCMGQMPHGQLRHTRLVGVAYMHRVVGAGASEGREPAQQGYRFGRVLVRDSKVSAGHLGDNWEASV